VGGRLEAAGLNRLWGRSARVPHSGKARRFNGVIMDLAGFSGVGRATHPVCPDSRVNDLKHPSAGLALSEIQETAAAVAQATASISAGSQDQSRRIKLVEQSVAQIDMSVQGMSNLSRDGDRQALRLKTETSKLRQLVASFVQDNGQVSAANICASEEPAAGSAEPQHQARQLKPTRTARALWRRARLSSARFLLESKVYSAHMTGRACTGLRAIPYWRDHGQGRHSRIPRCR
jgi:hypothetical protein